MPTLRERRMGRLLPKGEGFQSHPDRLGRTKQCLTTSGSPPSPFGRRCRAAADEGFHSFPHRLPVRNVRCPESNTPHPPFGRLLPKGEGFQGHPDRLGRTKQCLTTSPPWECRPQRSASSAGKCGRGASKTAYPHGGPWERVADGGEMWVMHSAERGNERIKSVLWIPSSPES
jgi:hypothetical protein